MKKQNCKECQKLTTSLVLIMNEEWTYEPYCLQCARVFFSNVYPKMANPQSMNLTVLNQISRIHDTNMANYIIKKKGGVK